MLENEADLYIVVFTYTNPCERVHAIARTAVR